MRLNLNKNRKILIKVLVLFFFIFPVIFYLNAGSLTDTYWKVAQSVIFTGVFIMVLVWPQSKKDIFLLGLFLIIIMIVFYVFDLIDWADLAGSTSMGIIMINLLTYLPQIMKLGYIKKI